MRIVLPFINLEYTGYSFRQLPVWFKLLFLGVLAIPITVLITGFLAGFGLPDAHYAEITAALANVQTPPAGFWQGMWDGLVAPLSFIFMLFGDEDVMFYSIHNTGFSYWIGYGILGGGLLYNAANRGD